MRAPNRRQIEASCQSGGQSNGRGHIEALGSARFDIRHCGSHSSTGRNQARNGFGRIKRCTCARIDDEFGIAERKFDLFGNHEKFGQIALERGHDVFNAGVGDDGE